jgi:hypothetical protein
VAFEPRFRSLYGVGLLLLLLVFVRASLAKYAYIPWTSKYDAETPCLMPLLLVIVSTTHTTHSDTPHHQNKHGNQALICGIVNIHVS